MVLIKRIFLLGLLASIIASFVAASAAVALIDLSAARLPGLDRVVNYQPEEGSKFLDRHGELVHEFTKEDRIQVSYDEIPPKLVEAFIAAEDKNFWNHKGFDPVAIARAIKGNVSNDRIVSGASTITQQLVKNLLLSSDQTMSRKISEVLLAYQLEQKLSKKEIMERYLNAIYLGRGAYGVAAAAKIHFDKELDELSLAQMAYLASLPKAPSVLTRNFEKAYERMAYVLDRMEDIGYITIPQRDQAKAEEILLVSRAPSATQPYLIGAALEQLQAHGEIDVYADGLEVRTHMDPEIDDALHRALVDGLTSFHESRNEWAEAPADIPRGIPETWKVGTLMQNGDGFIIWHDEVTYELSETSQEWLKKSSSPIDGRDSFFSLVDTGQTGQAKLHSIPEIQGAAIVMDPETGGVLGLSGGFLRDGTGFDRATKARRQPGSALKPFIYGKALEEGWLPSSPILDSPVAVKDGSGKIWRPGDHSQSALGFTTLRKGLEMSRNTVSLRLFEALGASAEQVFHQVGLYQGERIYASTALGANELTLVELASAYTAIAGDRYRPASFLMDRVDPGQEVFDPITRAQLRSMMRGVVQRGTARQAFEGSEMPVHGKTGTSNDAKDVWFVGFTKDYIVAVYIGYDQPRPLGRGSAGGSLAAPIVRDVFEALYANETPSDFSLPDGVFIQNVDPATGLEASNGIPEIFRK